LKHNAQKDTYEGAEMEFRPCIDIHNGKVKQIVGSSLCDANDHAIENFVSDRDSAYYAALYRDNGLCGGHIILLNGKDSPYYQATRAEAIKALQAYPNGMQIGGGIHARNAAEYIAAGASHVIVTSYLFENGKLSYDRMKKLVDAVGKEHVVFDLSCKRTPQGYCIMTDRWQTYTGTYLTPVLLKELEQYCDEYLIHAVNVEGKSEGIEKNVVELLAGYEGNAITYAGGIHSFEDLEALFNAGKGRIHATIGSALDLFGGPLSFEELVKAFKGDSSQESVPKQRELVYEYVYR